MNCLNDVIFNYDMAVRCLASRHLENVIRFRSKIDMVFGMLSDDESRYAYGQDIMYCMLSNFIQQELATTIAGNVTSAEFMGLAARAASMPEFGPIAHQGTPSSNDIKHQCIAATFLLEQYRYRDLVKVRPGDVCIDAGACLGDTAAYFCRNGARKVYSFEIDRSNLACMRKTADALSLGSKIEICEAALSDSNGQMHYLPDTRNCGAGKIMPREAQGSYPVKTTTIDVFCMENGIHPDFIKMDIEGSEPAALEGARQTILRDRPRLAVSIYHAWQHRWEIPLLLRGMAPDYDFYVKKSHPYTETVLFAAPRQA